MNESNTYCAFISYASVDLGFATEAQRRLTAAGFRVWFDKARLNPGCNWHKEIETACEASRVLLPVLTPCWRNSEWAKFETYGAEAVIPLIFAGSFNEVSTPPLTRFQAQALELSQSDDAAWERLFAVLHELLAKPAPDRVSRLVDLRYAANPHFVGREKELNQIHEELHQTPTAALTQGRARAVTALGGVGKTTLARQYAEKFWRCYPQIFWIDCRLGVETEFARLCDLLIPEQSTSTNVAEKAHIALRELQSRTDRLLILDNAEDEASIQAWIPKTGHCRTLITSRFAGWSAAIRSIHLNVLEPEPARALLVSRAKTDEFACLQPQDQTACDELAKELGYLPLAIEQAAAYIHQQGMDFGFAEYLRLYETATQELLAAGVLGSTEYPDSVMTTWKTTTAKLGPASRAILRLCSFLAPTPLPLTVLTNGMDTLCGEAAVVAGHRLTTPQIPESWVRQQVQLLRAYSLVEATGQAITFHPLVQTVERLQLDETSGERRETLGRSLCWIDDAYVDDPADVRNWPTLDPLASHAKVVVRHADNAGLSGPTARLMSHLGTFLLTKAQHAEAEPLLRRALAIAEQDFGSASPEVSAALNNLATLFQATNRLAEGESLMRRSLAIDEQGFGEDHARVAIDLINLAGLLQTSNRLAEAEPLLWRAVAIDEQCLGKDRLAVAVALNNLARLFVETNRLAEAEPLFRRALAIDEQGYGVDHPKVAIRLNNLAILLRTTNRLAEAEPLMRRALAIDERAYGHDHPKVSIRLSNLGAFLQEAGGSAEIETLLRRALAIDEQTYGKNHPEVAAKLHNLCDWLRATGRVAEAEPLVRRALAINEQSYGENHPNVAKELHALGLLLMATNRTLEAEPLLRRALAIIEESSGVDHPNVASALNGLGGLLMEAKRFTEAEPLLRRAITIYEKSLGKAHPQVAMVVHNLAGLLTATNRRAEAEPLLWQALAIGEQSYGDDHPTVARHLGNLARFLVDVNRWAEAEQLMRRMVRILINVTHRTGHEHPELDNAIRFYELLLRLMGMSEKKIRRRLDEMKRSIE